MKCNQKFRGNFNGANRLLLNSRRHRPAQPSLSSLVRANSVSQFAYCTSSAKKRFPLGYFHFVRPVLLFFSPDNVCLPGLLLRWSRLRSRCESKRGEGEDSELFFFKSIWSKQYCDDPRAQGSYNQPNDCLFTVHLVAWVPTKHGTVRISYTPPTCV